MSIFVKESALRALVREALDGSMPSQTPGPDDVVKISHVVDPQAAETDLDDPDFRPQDAMELKSGIRRLIDTVPDEKAAEVYGKVKATVNDAVSTYTATSSARIADDDERHRAQMKGEGKSMTIEAKNSEIKRVEETVRRAIRLHLAEQSYGGNVMEAEDDDEEGKPKRRGRYKDTALGHMGDEGTNFSKIATELGFSVSGAKQAVDKAMRKTKFLQTKIDPEDLEIMILMAMKDYIDHLASVNEPPAKQADVDPAEWEKEMEHYRAEMAELGLDPNGEMENISDEDVQLMKDHPEIVRTLPGFRDFLHNYVRRAAKSMGEKIN